MIRLAAALAIAMPFVTGGAEQARADWCGIGSQGVTNCGYPSVEQCRIGLNGVGNCYQNGPSAPATSDTARRTKPPR